MRNGIILFRKEIAVKYKEVDAIVPQLWTYYDPHLTIHVGLNVKVKSFVLEKKANKQQYKIADEDEQWPKGYCNACPGPAVVSTTLDVDRICTEFNNNKRKLRDPRLRAQSSDDAEKYLCEYIYYTSLSVGRSPTLFVHVPPEYTDDQIAQGLERILELCLEQLPEEGNCSYELNDNFYLVGQTQTLYNVF